MGVASRILVVDDSPLTRAGISRVLAGEGLVVTEAASGTEACAAAERDAFDLVTLDIEMPGLSGFETLRILKARHPDLPVVMISGVSSLDRAIEAIRLGAYDYVAKPVNAADLANCARRALAQRALERENRRLIQDLQGLNAGLERLVGERTAELEQAHRDLREQHGRLEEAYSRLKELDDLKTKFVTVTSHELRTPLAIVAGLLESVGAEALAPERRARALEAMRRSVERLTELVARITDLSHLGAALVRYRRVPVAFGPILAAVAADLAPLVEERRLALETDVPADLPPVRADAERIGQLLGNLLLNAIRFTPDGGRIGVDASAPTNGSGMVTVRVRDTGIGIPEGELERIFEAFYEIAPWEHHHSGKVQFGSGGLGLGLAIARRIAEAHGGTIRADSGLARGEPGSVFTFTLPVAEADAPGESRPEPGG